MLRPTSDISLSSEVSIWLFTQKQKNYNLLDILPLNDDDDDEAIPSGNGHAVILN